MGVLQDQLKKLRIYRDKELDDLSKYPLRSKIRNVFLKKIDNTRKNYIVKHKKKKLDEWRNKEVICECGFTTTNNNLRHHKKSKNHLNILNVDEENNKIICECGGKYLESNKSHHIKTKKHQLFISKSS